MGSKGIKPRKPRRALPKVPRYEEPNEIPLAGLGGGAATGVGREGHSAGHHHNDAGHHNDQPGRFGRFLLRTLGLRPNQHRR